MKYLYLLSFLLLGIICSSCGAGTFPSSQEDETYLHAERVQLPPTKESTLEELTEQTVDFRNYIINSYQDLQKLAADDTSYEAGRELTQKLEEQYGERIAEFAEIDFTGMTREELTEYLKEFTSLTTVIREAKDALTLE